jgi:hypothetical protein
MATSDASTPLRPTAPLLPPVRRASKWRRWTVRITEETVVTGDMTGHIPDRQRRARFCYCHSAFRGTREHLMD